MHAIQEKILKLSHDHDVINMKLVELGRLLGVAHPQIVKHHRDQLVRNNLLAPKSQTASAKVLFDKGLLGKSDLIAIPIMGAANAGPATIYADDQVRGYLRVSSTLLRSTKSTDQLFALQAIGMSMNRAKVNGSASIDSGDYIIADNSPFNPKTGDYVVSLIDGMANIKKFVLDKVNQQIVLMSESSEDFAPIFIHPDDAINYVVQAKVVQVVKTPKLA